MKFQFRFESAATHNYVKVLDDSPVFKGPVASQNAGSSDGGGIDGGLYYRVAGGGLNHLFDDALGVTLVPRINSLLVQAYDARFGVGAWQADSAISRADRLTSFYIPIPRPLPKDASVGANVVAMVYSVGPHLPTRIVERDAFRQVYVDALLAVATAQRAAGPSVPRMALRLTLLPTGIYGGIQPSTPDTVVKALNRDVAALVLEAAAAAAKGPHATDLPTTILVNADRRTPPGKEVDAFTHAAAAHGIQVSSTGFDFDT